MKEIDRQPCALVGVVDKRHMTSLDNLKSCIRDDACQAAPDFNAAENIAAAPDELHGLFDAAEIGRTKLKFRIGAARS
ncbi:MAG: hypothetical protein R3A46_02370 [Thermomicrobiales bacterium]